MATPFLSSEEYDERAHRLYNAGDYDRALEMLKEGLVLYPDCADLYVGLGYTRLAREEFAWARQSSRRRSRWSPITRTLWSGSARCCCDWGEARKRSSCSSACGGGRAGMTSICSFRWAARSTGPVSSRTPASVFLEAA